MPPGIEGTVIDVRVFNRTGGDKDERAKSIEDAETAQDQTSRNTSISRHHRQTRTRIWRVPEGKSIGQTLMGKKKGEGAG